MPSRFLPLLLLLNLSAANAAGVFVDDQQASPYQHDLVGQLAGRLLLSVCGEGGYADHQAKLIALDNWRASPDAPPAGVMIRHLADFAGQPGLHGQFRIGRDSCTLTLSPYQASGRAGDELAYAVSEAAGKTFGDEENGWQPEQAFSGLHRVDPAGMQHQQTMHLQFQQHGGTPSDTYFAVFDRTPDAPRILLGKRRFDGQVTFGMADSRWQAKRTQSGRAILTIRGKDPVDPRQGGYHVASFARLNGDTYTFKTWLPIGDTRPPFRLQRSLGDAPLLGFASLQIAETREGGVLLSRLSAEVIEQIPGLQVMLQKGLYPVYLSLDRQAVKRLLQAEFFTVILAREGGSEIRVQYPAGSGLAELLRHHLEVR